MSEAEQTSTGKAFTATMRRDLLIAFKRKNDLLNPFMFFFIVATLFPIGVSPEPDRLGEGVPAEVVDVEEEVAFGGLLEPAPAPLEPGLTRRALRAGHAPRGCI